MFVLKTDLHCEEWFTLSTQCSTWKQNICTLKQWPRSKASYRPNPSVCYGLDIEIW